MLTAKEIDSAFKQFIKSEIPFQYCRIGIYDGFMIIGSVGCDFSFENDIGKTDHSQIVTIKARNIERPTIGFYAAFDAFKIFNINNTDKSLDYIKKAKNQMIKEIKSKIDEYYEQEY